jgi:Fic family protein
MNEQEINYFLDGVTAKQDLIESIEALRSELRTAMQPMMEPVYKSNIWLKRADLHPNERIIMQLIYEIDDTFTVKKLANLTGLTRKCIRENFYKLVDRGYIAKLCGNDWERTISQNLKQLEQIERMKIMGHKS